MDRIIEIKVNGSYLTKDNRYAGVQHEANAKKLRIEFDEGWDGYAKKVTFWNALGLNPVERTLTADLLEDITESTRIYLCPIPGEAMDEAGELTFVIDGYVSGIRQRSVEDHLTVKAADYIENADQPVDPTPTQAEQLQAQIDTMLEDMAEQAVIATDAAEAAKESEINAKQSEINAKESAESAANASEAKEAIENMTATGTNVPADSETPIVEKSLNENGSVNIHFNVRQGVSGVYVGGGDMPEGYNVQVDYTDEASVLTTQELEAAQQEVAANVAAAQAAQEAAEAAAEKATAITGGEYVTLEYVKTMDFDCGTF